MRAPMRLCSGRGGTCGARVRTGRCPDCTRATDASRGTAQARGYDRQWSTFARTWKRRHPLCGQRHDGQLSLEHSQCVREGRLTVATDVDHIVPHKGPTDPAFYALANLQSLCHACHSRKTATIDSGFAPGGRSNL
jgi:5-methylcytosine-specific restriction protein A